MPRKTSGNTKAASVGRSYRTRQKKSGGLASARAPRRSNVR